MNGPGGLDDAGSQPALPMSYHKVTRFISAADGTRLAYHTHLGDPASGESEEALAARPAVLLTSGIGTSENFWRYLVGALASEYRVVHWDYRGHGSSERAASGDYSIQAQVDDLIRVTEAVMANGQRGLPPIQVGFSMGVAVLLELYRRRPELVPALVLLAGGPDAPWAGTLPFRIPGATAAVQRAMSALTPVVPLAAPLVRWLLSSPFVYPAGRMLGLLRKRAPREDIDQFMHALCSMDTLAYWHTLRALMGARASDVLPRVKVPVLVVAASHDILVPRSEVERIREALPSARYLLVEDAGHATLLEAGPEVAAEVTRFVRKFAPHRESASLLH